MIFFNLPKAEPARRNAANNNDATDKIPVPPIIDCQLGKQCSTHLVKYVLHYDKEAWENFSIKSIELKNIGTCKHCNNCIKGKRGVTKENQMWDHIFNECLEYPYSKVLRQKK